MKDTEIIISIYIYIYIFIPFNITVTKFFYTRTLIKLHTHKINMEYFAFIQNYFPESLFKLKRISNILFLQLLKNIKLFLARSLFGSIYIYIQIGSFIK